ncbi:alpha/beta fold hydrolase [Thalassotalea euphylliae]|uniref:Alpha/beta fold hydrolase n=2 Tax=Thalassotalea euphylliae TaxID=1655234 RepID=A0A3E0UP39_9GAMM|nr:alpha/beta fold hydrolase [Thalassotalea euphylliae]
MRLILNFLVIVFALFAMSCSHTSSQQNSQIQNSNQQELIVLAHGLGRSDTAMWWLEQQLEKAGYQVCSLDYDTIGESVDSVFGSTSEQIDQCLTAQASTVHFVGHSLGGLVIRSYLQAHQQLLASDRFGAVVLMGTPNKGSEVADYYQGTWLMSLGGEISQSLVTNAQGLSQQLEDIDINAGVIAGTKGNTFTKSLFTSENDGLVSVESTKLKHMSDFITIDVGHAIMRYSSIVAEQTIHYLRHGKFMH